jgi:hypothetical protein
MVTCVIDFNVDDTRADVHTLLARIAPILAAPTGTNWVLDLSGCRYFGPDAVAIIAALYRRAWATGSLAAVPLPSEPKVAAFCAYSGLARLCWLKSAPNTDHPSNETVPLQFVQGSSWNDADPIIRLVHRHLALDAVSEDSLRTCLNELLQNIEDHAESPVGGVFCARYVSTRKEIRVAVADAGIGVGTSLRKRFPAMDDRQALTAVLRGGFTAKSRDRNLGQGVFNVSRMVHNAGGQFSLISGQASAHVGDGRHVAAQAVAWKYPGTVVMFTLPVREADRASNDDDDPRR